MRHPITLRPYLLLAFTFLTPAPSSSGQDFGFDILGLQNEDFFQAPSVTNAQVSADGSKVAYTRSGYDGERIHILDRTNNADTILYRPPSADGSITYVSWLDSESILFQNYFGDLYTLNVSSQLLLKIYDAERVFFFRNAIVHANTSRPRVLSTLPADPKNILVSAYDDKGIRRVYQLPLEEWDADKLPDPLFKNARDFDLWHADSSGTVRLAMKLNQSGTTLFQRIGSSERWQEMSSLLRADGTKLAVDLDKNSVLKRRDFLLGFDFDPNQFYFASNQETDTAALYLYDIEKGVIVKEVAHDPRYDLIDTTTGNASPIVSQLKNAWVGIRYEADKPSTIWFDPEYQTLQEQIDSLLPDSQNLVADWSQDESIVVVQAIWSERPRESYLYDRTSQDLRQIGSADHPLAQTPGSPSKTIEFTGAQGHTIQGYFTPGKTESDSPAPLVMLVHGGPWARDTFSYDPFAQCLAHNGYSTLRINYRGSTGYGYEHFAAAAKDYGWAVQDDIRDARAWAIEQGLARPESIAIMGFSYGGYAAALAAASQHGSFRCAIPISGIYDIVYESKEIKKKTGRGITYEYWKQLVGSETKDRARLEAISPTKLAKDISIPLLIAHGTLDPIASIEHAHQFTTALERNHKEFEYIELEEEGHSLDLPKNQAFLFDKINAFLATHLP